MYRIVSANDSVSTLSLLYWPQYHHPVMPQWIILSCLSWAANTLYIGTTKVFYGSGEHRHPPVSQFISFWHPVLYRLADPGVSAASLTGEYIKVNWIKPRKRMSNDWKMRGWASAQSSCRSRIQCGEVEVSVCNLVTIKLVQNRRKWGASTDSHHHQQDCMDWWITGKVGSAPLNCIIIFFWLIKCQNAQRTHAHNKKDGKRAGLIRWGWVSKLPWWRAMKWQRRCFNISFPVMDWSSWAAFVIYSRRCWQFRPLGR